MVCVLGGLCAEAELSLEEVFWLGDRDRTGVRARTHVLEGLRPPGGAGGQGRRGQIKFSGNEI